MDPTHGSARDGQRPGPAPEAPSKGLAQDAASAPAGGEVPALDFARAARSLGGKVDLLHELLGLFLGELPGRLEAIRAAFEGEDFEKLRQLAHTLKGSAGMLQALRVQAAARALEAAARSGEKAACGGSLRLLEAEAAGLAKAVRDHGWSR
ncbi:MAG TPA: Hpt domain-containing protein [Planctomycetota bacterium]|nr:Hpt domain-containing protein [Planctomycetota bacterium]HRR80374.1 Hpt domain-containing protein [Planctomycetota bacterium]